MGTLGVCTIVFLLYYLGIIAYRVEVPTGSMLPDIQLNEQLLILRNTFVKSYLRGDVVVFHQEDEEGTSLVKRLIGLPGETVDVRDGTVFVDGEVLIEDYLGSNDGWTGTFFIPEDCYLFLGDNRADSLDARYWEQPYIHQDLIEGKVIAHIYPVFRLGG